MPKYLKYSLFGFAGLISVFALLLIGVALTVDPNTYKPQIVQTVLEKKQRTLLIEGDIKLKLFPKLGVDLGKTRLSEHQGAQEFATLDSVKLFIGWLPLLKGQVVVDRISVNGARANLIRFANGSTNIDDLLIKDEAGQIKFDIQGVKITRSAVILDDRMSQRIWRFADFEMESGRLKDHIPTHIKLDFNVVGDQPKIAAHVEMQSGLRFALNEKRYVLNSLKLKMNGEAAGIQNLVLHARGDLDLQPTQRAFSLANFKLDMTGMRATDKLSLALDAPKLVLNESSAEGSKLALLAGITQTNGNISAALTLPDLTGNAKQFNVREMRLVINGTHGDSSIKATLSGPLDGSLDAQTFQLNQLVGTLDVAHPTLRKGGVKLVLAGDAAGDIAKQQIAIKLNSKLDNSALQAKLALTQFAQPHFNFDIAIDRLDLDRYLAPKAKAEASQPGKPIDLSRMQSLNASGSVRIGQLQVANFKSTNVRLDLKATGSAR